jgi:hypothetical protein
VLDASAPNIGKSAKRKLLEADANDDDGPRSKKRRTARSAAPGGDTSMNAEGSKGKGKESRGETTTIKIQHGESLRAFIIIGAFCSHLLFLLPPEGGKYTPSSYDSSFYSLNS